MKKIITILFLVTFMGTTVLAEGDLPNGTKCSVNCLVATNDDDKPADPASDETFLPFWLFTKFQSEIWEFLN